ncbi:hypothetical protein ABZ345_16330 [Lentzea sp. NPDC005914]|uniref:hypothetical protein n=1 Tax=Lentzea sp. NPDC005914 TaxID=3154572 RepID=UPI0033F65E98
MGRHKFRKLVVGDDRFIWTVGHGCREYRELVRFRKFGSAGHVLVVFRSRPAEGHFTSDEYDNGTAKHADGRHLNLHLPGVARALMDEVISRGWQPDSTGHVEMDGWDLFDAVTFRIMAHNAERPPDRDQAASRRFN